MDLKERGWDALLGDGAESPPEFRWADPVLDHRQLLSARDEAFRLVKQDPGMRRNREMVEAVAVRWGPWLGEDFSTEKAEQPQGDGRGKEQQGRRRRRRRREPPCLSLPPTEIDATPEQVLSVISTSRPTRISSRDRGLCLGR